MTRLDARCDAGAAAGAAEVAADLEGGSAGELSLGEFKELAAGAARRVGLAQGG